MPLMSTFMPLANASTALSSWLDSHGTWLNSRWWAASRAARNVRISLRGCSRPSAERLDRLGHQRGDALGAQRQSDIGGGQHLLGQLAQGLAQLRAEGHPAHLGHHRQQRAGHRSGPPRAARRPTPSRSARPPDRTAASRCPGCCRSTRSASRPPPWWCPPAARWPRPARSRPAAPRRRSRELVASGIGADEADRTGRQLAGQVVVDRSGLLAAGGHRACAAEHLAEPGEDLAEVGHVESCRRPTRTDPAGRIGVLLGLVTDRGRLHGRSRRAGRAIPSTVPTGEGACGSRCARSGGPRCDG